MSKRSAPGPRRYVTKALLMELVRAAESDSFLANFKGTARDVPRSRRLGADLISRLPDDGKFSTRMVRAHFRGGNICLAFPSHVRVCIHLLGVVRQTVLLDMTRVAYFALPRF